MNRKISVLDRCDSVSRWIVPAVAGFAMAASAVVAGPLEGGVSESHPTSDANPVGAVYTMTNWSEENEIVVFARYPNGKIEETARVATGGAGSGEPLQSVGSLQLVGERFLLAANPGDSTISVFRLRPDDDDRMRLELVSREPSGGTTPVSIAAHERGLVYVLNAGSELATIAGFRLSERGQLRAIPGSIQALPHDGSKPAQIVFAPEGRAVLVSDPETNTIAAYGIDERTGSASLALVHAVHGGAGHTHMVTPWGMAFDSEGNLYTAEAAEGLERASSVGSHEVEEEHGQVTMEVSAPSIPIGQTMATALLVSKNRKYVYTANAGSDTISVVPVRVREDRLTGILPPQGGWVSTGQKPIALAASRNDRFLYSLNIGDGSISAFRRVADGGLTALQQEYGLPPSATGLAAD